MTTLRQMVAAVLSEHNIFNDFSIKTVSFSDLARGEAKVVTIKNWKPDPIADVVKSTIVERAAAAGHKVLVNFSGGFAENPEPHYELQSSDVGKPHIRAFGRVWPVSGFIGHIMPKDVGKRVYERGDIVQVENDDQLDFRLHGLRGQGGHATHVTGCPGCGKAINPIPAPGTYNCSGCGAAVRVNPRRATHDSGGPELPKIITHKNMWPLLDAISAEPYFQPGPQTAPRPKWVDRSVILEMPLGEIARDWLTTFALTGGKKPEPMDLTGKEQFNAQGSEGKVQIRKSLFMALMNLRDLIPEHRGRIIT